MIETRRLMERGDRCPAHATALLKTEGETQLLNSRGAAVRFYGQLITNSLKLDWSREIGLSVVIQLGEFS